MPTALPPRHHRATPPRGAPSRRRVLTAGAAALVVCPLVTVPAGCADPDPEPVDPLLPLARAARADADALAAATDAGQRETAAIRARHADALEAELVRVGGPAALPQTATATSSPGTSAAGTDPSNGSPGNGGSPTAAPTPVTPVTTDALRTTLREAARAATDVALSERGYRGCLAAAVAAACTTAAEVTLR